MAEKKALEDDSDIDLLQIAQTLWRGKLWIALTALLAVLLGGYYAYGVAVPKYTATATLALQLRNERVFDFESVISGVSTDQSSLNTELAVMTSRGMMTKLVQELDLTSDPEFNGSLRPEPTLSLGGMRRALSGLFGASDPDMPPPSDAQILNGAIASVQSAIAVSTGRNSYIFNISATSQSPEKSALIANTLAELYVEDQIDVKFQATENAANWLSERVIDLQIELEARGEEIAELRSGSALISPEALELLNRQAVDARDRFRDAEIRIEQLQSRIEALTMARQSGEIGAMVAVASDPALARLAAQIENGGNQALAAFDQRYEQLIAQASMDLERSSAQLASLEASAAQIAEQLESQSAALVRLQQLEREAQATTVLYETFLARLRETTVQQGIQQADSRILSEATSGRLVEPRKSRIMALSLILGAMLGAAWVLGREYLQNTFRTAEDLERMTGVSVMGQVPRIPIRSRSELVGFLVNRPTSAAAEAIRNLRTSILLSDIDNPPQVIMSTSSIPNEGKTTQAIALAHNLSGLGKKVLLVEGDIRRRTFGQYFPTDEKKGGILSVISGKVPLAEAVMRVPGMDMDILMGEKSNINAADVFSSDTFRALIENLRKTYDYVVIDTPPVLVVPDARVIAQLVDAIIYTVHWDSTTQSQVREGLKQFEALKLKATGLVLAQIDEAGMKRYGYGGKYGAYSRYGAAYYEA